MSRKKIIRLKIDLPKVPKIRRKWIRNPVEQVVNNKKTMKPTRRQLRDSAIDDYKETSEHDKS